MEILPVVRSLNVCDFITIDYGSDPNRPTRVSLEGIVSAIRLGERQTYPVVRTLRVFVQLTEARGTARIGLSVIASSTNDVLYSSDDRPVQFGNNPLAVVGIPFRIRDLQFPRADYYWVRFRYNSIVLAEQSIRVIGVGS